MNKSNLAIGTRLTPVHISGCGCAFCSQATFASSQHKFCDENSNAKSTTDVDSISLPKTVSEIGGIPKEVINKLPFKLIAKGQEAKAEAALSPETTILNPRDAQLRKRMPEIEKVEATGSRFVVFFDPHTSMYAQVIDETGENLSPQALKDLINKNEFTRIQLNGVNQHEHSHVDTIRELAPDVEIREWYQVAQITVTGSSQKPEFEIMTRGSSTIDSYVEPKFEDIRKQFDALREQFETSLKQFMSKYRSALETSVNIAQQLAVNFLNYLGTVVADVKVLINGPQQPEPPNTPIDKTRRGAKFLADEAHSIARAAMAPHILKGTIYEAHEKTISPEDNAAYRSSIALERNIRRSIDEMNDFIKKVQTLQAEIQRGMIDQAQQTGGLEKQSREEMAVTS